MEPPGLHLKHRLIEVVEPLEAVLGGVGDELLYHAVVSEGVLKPLGVAHGVLAEMFLCEAKRVSSGADNGLDILRVVRVDRESGVDADMMFVIVEIPWRMEFRQHRLGELPRFLALDTAERYEQNVA